MPIDRRTVLSTAAGLGLGLGLPRSARGESSAKSPARDGGLNAITYNLHAFGPIAHTDEGRRLIGVARGQGHLVERYALELAPYEPDVLCIQEASSEAQITTLAQRLGLDHVYFHGGQRAEGERAHPMFNGAILTRFPILDQEDCPSPSARAERGKVFTRHMGRVLLDTGDERWGDGGRVAVIGCHMLPSWENTTHIREAEIRAVGEAIQGDVESGRSVLVLGDMNQQPTTSEYAGWATLGLKDTFTAKGVGARQTIRSLGPTETIDYVFARGPILEHLQSCRTLAEGLFRAAGGGPESAGDFALSDHMPVLARFG